MIFDLFTEARGAANEVLQKVFAVPVAKALDPLDRDDFETIVRELATRLRGHIVPVERAALKRAVAALDVNWNTLSSEARKKVIRHAGEYLGAPVVRETLPKVEATLEARAREIVGATKKQVVERYDLSISAAYGKTDERIATFAAKSQGHYVRNELGVRQEAFSEQAAQIVAGGLEKGFGTDEIARTLRTGLVSLGRGDDYWTMIAMVFANRARTATQLFSFGEAGIQTYRFEAILDEVTSVQCRFMHGRTFRTDSAIDSLRALEESDSPEDIRTLQPFLNFSRGQLYYGKASDPRHVADVEENAFGQKDEVGRFGRAMSDSHLAAAGIRFPPIHGHCRSTVIPVFE